MLLGRSLFGPNTQLGKKVESELWVAAHGMEQCHATTVLSLPRGEVTILVDRQIESREELGALRLDVSPVQWANDDLPSLQVCVDTHGQIA